jgi:hypothetical protein
MARTVGVVAVCALLNSAPAAAWAQAGEPPAAELPGPPETASPPAEAASPPAEAASPPAEAASPPAPPSADPSEAPPAPPFADEARPAPPTASLPSGQWVYTQQYGWVWMPYPDDYTYVPPDGYGEPYAYVYTPAFGWTWVVAPWVWGFGPWPYFGVHGPAYFGWYRHGWWRSPWRWHFAPGPRFAYHGVRPAPPRGMVWRGAPGRAVAPVRAPSVRGGGGRHGGRR